MEPWIAETADEVFVDTKVRWDCDLAIAPSPGGSGVGKQVCSCTEVPLSLVCFVCVFVY